eukprot:11214829-Lingulodinium_polyedra.AAC.1
MAIGRRAGENKQPAKQLVAITCRVATILWHPRSRLGTLPGRAIAGFRKWAADCSGQREDIWPDLQE